MRNREDFSSTIAQQYYDSQEADYFYSCVWGGEDIHVGIYTNKTESVFTASRKTVKIMASFLKQPTDKTYVLDLGAGYGGAARYLSENFGCNVICLNISKVQNNKNIFINREKNIDNLIKVEEGNFEHLSYEKETFDIVWSQDALLHSNHRARVLEEVFRVLSVDGEFIFTDIMESSGCPQKTLEPILNRIHLKSMATLDFYMSYGKSLGFDVEFYDFSENLAIHYSRILEETKDKIDRLEKFCSKEFLERTISGLEQWIDASEQHRLTWGILKFTKKRSKSNGC